VGPACNWMGILVDENGEETYEDFFYSTRNVCTQVYEYIGTRPRQYCTFFLYAIHADELTALHRTLWQKDHFCDTTLLWPAGE
jgi:hypothetical protein